MKTLKIILVLVLFASYVEAFQPYSLERLSPGDNLKIVKDKINRNSDKTERKDREGQQWDNEHYPQWGELASGQFIWNGLYGFREAIVYLPEKYASTTDYIVMYSRSAPVLSTPANYLAIRYSDSSFAVLVDTTGAGIMWQTIGVKKTKE